MTLTPKAGPARQQPERLNSWKEIAAYLERDERTVKRWEKTRNLPVRRLPGGPSRVFAFRSEIDTWQISSSAQSDHESGEIHAVTTAPVANASAPASKAARPSTHFELFVALASVAVAAALTFGLYMHARRATSAAEGHIPPREASNLYLSARYYWNKRTPADLQLALRDFEAATRLDPQYAAAYAGIADSYGLSTEFAAMPPQQAYPRMLEAARRSVALDPNLAEAHRALAFVLFYWDWDRTASRREFERALTLDPRDPTTYHWYANVLLQSQDLKGALRMIDKAREIDPTARAILADRGLILNSNGLVKDALEVWRSLEKSDPEYLPPHWYIAAAMRDSRDMPAYLAELRTIASLSHAPADAEKLAACEEGFRRNGEQGVLVALADLQVRLAAETNAGYMEAATALDRAHRSEDALRYIELAYTHRDPEFPLLSNPGGFADLAANPRFLELRRRSLLPFPQSAADRPAITSRLADVNAPFPEGFDSR